MCARTAAAQPQCPRTSKCQKTRDTLVDTRSNSSRALASPPLPRSWCRTAEQSLLSRLVCLPGVLVYDGALKSSSYVCCGPPTCTPCRVRVDTCHSPGERAGGGGSGHGTGGAAHWAAQLCLRGMRHNNTMHRGGGGQQAAACVERRFEDEQMPVVPFCIPAPRALSGGRDPPPPARHCMTLYLSSWACRQAGVDSSGANGVALPANNEKLYQRAAGTLTALPACRTAQRALAREGGGACVTL